MISTLLIISFGCLYNADLVRPSETVETGMFQRCFTNLDCNTGEKCSLYVKLQLKSVYLSSTYKITLNNHQVLAEKISPNSPHC